MIQLLSQQKQKIKKVLNGSPVKSLVNPSERHQLLLHWNFDDGIAPFDHIVDQFDTDLGTIVLLYWYLSPGYLHKNSENDKAAYDLITKIEANVVKGFYTNKQISVDPSNVDGTNYLEEKDNIENLAKIPEVLKTQTPGQKHASVDLTDRYVNKVYPITEDDQRKLDSAIRKGIEALAGEGFKFTAESGHDEIINTINEYSLKRRPGVRGSNGKFTRQEINTFKNLDKLFAEQVKRKAGWKWHIHELHEQVLDFRDFVLVSPDGKYEWHPYLKSFVAELSNLDYVEGISVQDEFEAITDIENSIIQKIKENMDYKRSKDYPGKSDEEIIRLLAQKQYFEMKDSAYYKKKFEGKSEGEIIKTEEEDLWRSEINRALPGCVSLLGNHVEVTLSP